MDVTTGFLTSIRSPVFLFTPGISQIGMLVIQTSFVERGEDNE